MVLLLLSCKNPVPEDNEVDNNLIEISKEQFLSEKMSIGIPQKIAMEERISFTGKVVSMLNGVVKISAPVEGIVKDINVQTSQIIKANEVLLEIGGSALIDLQQEFATSSAKMKQLKANFDRSKQLYEENINTENEFMLAESRYKSELANYSALELKIQNIGLSISDIKNGKYADAYSLKSPISGQVSQIQCLEGQFITSEYEIAEVVNKDKIELKMAFFEKDFLKIKKGQKVIFKSMEETEEPDITTINRIENRLSDKSNTFNCYATIDKANTAYYAINQLVIGEVIVAADSVFAVPKTAVLSSGNKKYVLLVVGEDDNGYSLEKVDVKTGKTNKNYIELIDFMKDKPILISGTYNIEME